MQFRLKLLDNSTGLVIWSVQNGPWAHWGKVWWTRRSKLICLLFWVAAFYIHAGIKDDTKLNIISPVLNSVSLTHINILQCHLNCSIWIWALSQRNYFLNSLGKQIAYLSARNLEPQQGQYARILHFLSLLLLRLLARNQSWLLLILHFSQETFLFLCQIAY